MADFGISWDDYFMTLAYLCATRSKDQSTHIGAVIVGPDNEVRSTGYNSFPRNIDDDPSMHPERQQRPHKYLWLEHAERNAVYNAARVGTPTKECRIYTNGVPCSDCARAIIQAGIKEVITDARWDADESPEWLNSLAASTTMFMEAHIKHRVWAGKLLTVQKFKRGKAIDG